MEPGATETRPETAPATTGPAGDAPPTAAAAPASGGTGFGEWFWAGRRMAEIRRRAVDEPERAAVFDQRARISAELAARALDPAESFLSGRADALSCELYRESIYWALCSKRARRAATETLPDPGAPDALRSLWAELDAAALRVSVSEAELTAAGADFADKTFVDFAALSPTEQAQASQRLGRVAEGLLAVGSTARHEIDAVWFQRTLRLGAVALLLVAALVVISMVVSRREEGKDLAQGRPWRASSAYGSNGCRTPSQTCSESPDYFFHTEEQDKPWVEIDLGSPQLVAAVRIDNRKDCCVDRSVPLLVELSTDQNRFREVARRSQTFTTWKAEFEPVPARYVRVRVAGRAILHLSRVRVLAP